MPVVSATRTLMIGMSFMLEDMLLCRKMKEILRQMMFQIYKKQSNIPNPSITNLIRKGRIYVEDSHLQQSNSE